MGSLRDKFQRFMYGRYGTDKFNQFLLILSFVLLVISLFGFRPVYVLAFCILIFSYYRMLSRNYAKRAAENAWYLKVTWRIRSKLSSYGKMWRQRKTHKFFRCPSCRQTIRVPKGHGRVQVTCPKCRTSFERNT